MHACLGICSRDSLTATPVHGEIKNQKNALFTHHLFEGFAVSGQLCLSPIPVVESVHASHIAPQSATTPGKKGASEL